MTGRIHDILGSGDTTGSNLLAADGFFRTSWKWLPYKNFFKGVDITKFFLIWVGREDYKSTK